MDPRSCEKPLEGSVVSQKAMPSTSMFVPGTFESNSCSICFSKTARKVGPLLDTQAEHIQAQKQGRFAFPLAATLVLILSNWAWGESDQFFNVLAWTSKARQSNKKRGIVPSADPSSRT